MSNPDNRSPHKRGAKNRSSASQRSATRQEKLPATLPVAEDGMLVNVYVEGYEDVAFWRSIFDHYTTSKLRFEISVPTRHDLPKGKKVLLNTLSRSNPSLLLCVDSDFDYLFDDHTPQSRDVNNSRYMFHTYTYATENYLCYAPSLHNVCVKATKMDNKIFDFEAFMSSYSQIIYPLFLWYTYSAKNPVGHHLVTLVDFRNAVSISSLDINGEGRATLEYVARSVKRTVAQLVANHPEHASMIAQHADELAIKGLVPHQTYMFMHGHTLMDNVVMVLLNNVCDKLRQMAISRISASSKEGRALQNEISNYNNTQRSIRDVLLDNVAYTDSPLYRRLQADIELYISSLEL